MVHAKTPPNNASYHHRQATAFDNLGLKLTD